MLLDRSQRFGEIEEEEQQMISKVFDFGDKEAADVMVPRVDVVALSIDLPPEEALKAVMESPYTRYPVYRGSLDEILGILHVRDLFAALMDRGIEQVQLEDLLRTPYFVPETKDLASLLAEFRAQNLHMAIVLDEYGAMEGIVTLEDLLEEIVGEIEDEFDLPTTTSSGSTTARSASAGLSRSTSSTSRWGRSSRTRTTTPWRDSCSACSGAPPGRATRSSTRRFASAWTRWTERASRA